ncbi:hypothetical protein [Neotamlana nanhaiensis]|nr:hypothetical protein [Tamlana nanhaiensis]
MKTFKAFIAVLLLFVAWSCSKSESSTENEEQKGDFNIEGVWELRNLTFDETFHIEESQEIIKFVELIVNEGCELMTFEFKPDKSFIVEQYDVTDYNPTEEEVEYVVNCENIDTFTGTWDLQENQLMITTSDDDEPISITVRYESGMMILEDMPLATILPLDGHADFVYKKLGSG